MKLLFVGSGVYRKGLTELLQAARDLLPPVPDEKMWVPYLGHTLDAGMATLFVDEVIEEPELGAHLQALGWVDVDPGDQLDPRPLHDVTSHSAADRAQTVLNDANSV